MNLYLVLFLILILVIIVSMTKRDNFEMITTPFPNWFYKGPYDVTNWLVQVYPDRVQPECLSYNINNKYGSLDNLNYYSQAYRYWRY